MAFRRGCIGRFRQPRLSQVPSTMKATVNHALLPSGLSDVLPPDAEFEADALDRIMTVFASHGYQRAKPPLTEFEESLLAGPGTAMAAQTFRLMDPVSQRMMGVRADMTPQIARIAATRLKSAPRPLRLSYSGQVLRVKGSQLRPERQFTQAGAELIGARQAAADAEVVALGARALQQLGIEGLSVDLCMPTLVPTYCRETGFSEDAMGDIRHALDRKDAAAIAGLSDKIGTTGSDVLNAMLSAAGPSDKTLHTLSALALGPMARHEFDTLSNVVALVAAATDSVSLTVDPVENRGFEYHTGVTFTYFAADVRGELGSGGRYESGEADIGKEPATGFTLFLDTILRAMPRRSAERRLFVSANTPPGRADELRAQGWMTVGGLEEVSDTEAEAKRQQCSHLLTTGGIKEIDPQEER